MEMEGTDAKTGNSGAMTVTTDSWVATVPGYDEVKAFQVKMGEKMGSVFGSSMPAMGMMRPEIGKGFEQVAKEMAKLDGMPVESTVKMTGAGAGMPEGAATSDQQPEPQPSGKDAAAAAIGRMTGLGGFGGFGRKKKAEEQPKPSAEPPAQPQASQTASASLIETTMQLTSYASGPVDASKFEVPAGFKQVQTDLRRGPQQN
jgi:hypothetical protein